MADVQRPATGGEQDGRAKTRHYGPCSACEKTAEYCWQRAAQFSATRGNADPACCSHCSHPVVTS